MLERFNPVLRIVCLVLAGLVLYQLSRLVAHRDALENLNFSRLDLSVAAEASPVKATNAVKATNVVTSRVAMNKPPELPPAVQSRVDRITQSEILGAVVRPLPMALLGIAGKDIFLRAPNGQTGMIREGEELGGVKLLKIGVNRVLIEHEKEQKELTLFAGFGSESLLPKGEKNPP